MATGKFFREVQLSQQKSYADDILFPIVLSPTNTDSGNVTCNSFEEAIRSEKPWLESLLQKNGAILFRGFPVMSPSDFNSVVEAFGFPEFSYVGGRAPRIHITGRVYTANDSPLDKQIPFHHELAYIQDFPSKLFFYCDEEPGNGGETPIVLSHIVYENMKNRHPEFVAKLEEHGVKYISVTHENDDLSAIGGRGWKSVYMTDDKKVAEERAAKQGTRLEWSENGVKIISDPRPAIRFDKESQRKTWFLNHGFGALKSKVEGHDAYFELGNGDHVSEEAIKDCYKIMEEECVAIPWKRGDVVFVNNLMVLHGRLPLLKPPRRILASLCQ